MSANHRVTSTAHLIWGEQDQDLWETATRLSYTALPDAFHFIDSCSHQGRLDLLDAMTHYSCGDLSCSHCEAIMDYLDLLIDWTSGTLTYGEPQ